MRITIHTIFILSASAQHPLTLSFCNIAELHPINFLRKHSAIINSSSLTFYEYAI